MKNICLDHIYDDFQVIEQKENLPDYIKNEIQRLQDILESGEIESFEEIFQTMFEARSLAHLVLVNTEVFPTEEQIQEVYEATSEGHFPGVTDAQFDSAVKCLLHDFDMSEGRDLYIAGYSCSKKIMERLYEKAKEIGFSIMLEATSNEAKKLILDHGNEEGIRSTTYMRRTFYERYENIKNYIGIASYPSENIKYDKEKLDWEREESTKTFDALYDKLDLNSLHLPSEGDMKHIESISYEEYLQYYFRGFDLPLDTLTEENTILAEELDKIDRIRIKNDTGTDFSFTMENQTHKPCVVEVNALPCEVFSAPNLYSVNGTVKMVGVHRYKNEYIVDPEFVFENGKIVTFSAKEGEDVLARIVDADSKNIDLLTQNKGSRFLGEIGYGSNPYYRDLTKIKVKTVFDDTERPLALCIANLLFSEKATVHIAPGRSYKDRGKYKIYNGNESCVHHDFPIPMIDGEIWGDGKCIYKGGKWLFESLKGGFLNEGDNSKKIKKEDVPEWWAQHSEKIRKIDEEKKKRANKNSFLKIVKKFWK